MMTTTNQRTVLASGDGLLGVVVTDRDMPEGYVMMYDSVTGRYVATDGEHWLEGKAWPISAAVERLAHTASYYAARRSPSHSQGDGADD